MKTGRVILIMTILILLSFSVFAESFNVLVYPSNSEMERYIAAFFPQITADNAKKSLVLERLQLKADKELGEALAKAYKTEDEAKVNEAKEAYENRAVVLEDEPFFGLKLCEQHKEAYDIKSLESGDGALLDMICRGNEADLLVMPVISDIQNFKLLRLYVYKRGSDSLELVFEQIVSRDSSYFPVESAMKLGQMLCGEPMALLYLDKMVDGSEVTVDGRTVNAVDNYILCEAGRRIIGLEATGYSGKSVNIDLPEDTVSEIDASLQALLFENLRIESDPVADVLIGGVKMGSTPLSVDSYSVPTSIRLSHEGYSDAVIGLTKKRDSISISLKPAWMADEDILKKNKDDFYGAFARSLLIFGAKIVTRTLNKGDNTFLSVLDIAAGGALTVSIVDMVGCLIDYYRQTEYISP